MAALLILTNTIIGTNIGTMIPRLIEEVIIERLTRFNKIIIILGARQVGKSTLLISIQERLILAGNKVVFLNGDLDEDRQMIDTTSLGTLTALTQGVDLLIIDEAQRLTNPGLTLKILYDHCSKTKVLVTGSSSFEIKNKLSDTLTGRYFDFQLDAFSFTERLTDKKLAESLVDDCLLYGSYPEVALTNSKTDKILMLKKIVESYLFKDILTFQQVRNHQAIRDLTRAVAYQTGSLVSENELAVRLKIDRKTVGSYLEILEKSFVITRLYPFSKNPRREIGKNYKIYFLDLGIRNALIDDFNSLAIRADSGFLWENLMIIEKLKAYHNQGEEGLTNFWRSYGGAEVDYLEKIPNGGLKAFEFKINQNKLSRGAESFVKEYKSTVKVINRANFLDFLGIK